MFRKRKCPACDKEVKADWSFCPYCGEELTEARGVFGLFSEVEKEFKKLDKIFASSFRLPRFRFKPLRSGISITITSGAGRKPRVDVKTFGGAKKLEPEIKQRLGVKVPIEGVEARPMPKVTQEPETKVKKVGNKRIVEIKLPGVKSEKDVEIRRLEQSVEIRAFAKDKAYFTLLPVDPEASISKEFKDEILRLEIVK